MTNKQQTYKKSLIQKIQIVKSNVFSSDEERKEFMLSRFGVDSTTKLSIDELKLLLDFCNRNVSDIPILKATEVQLHKINTLWQEKAKNKSIEAMCSFTSKIAKRQVGFINELGKDEATKVIVALERMN
ncbi:regulatory protein GemA [Aliarcobacter butzleri]|uniref:phage protein GemA/Gp16 family protein n=1 Tax=Aliarcobacter butzleri TaxID=28197 RepID=UPI001EDD177E|nr:phage protein GemA/Gp16 family protein [Aliarcobacter butzleri]MCG3698860.1 regulatory protein GemA [Aliarcobacter butzleri]